MFFFHSHFPPGVKNYELKQTKTCLKSIPNFSKNEGTIIPDVFKILIDIKTIKYKSCDAIRIILVFKIFN